MNTMTALATVDGTIEADEDTILEAWQVLVDSGMTDTLPGTYGRTAQDLIDQGLING